MSLAKKIGLVVLVLFVIIQFFRPERNINTTMQPNDIFAHYATPDTVQALLKTACYDCHSNNTEYPWYTNIQPVGLWLQHHVDEGKRELNFSEFATYKAKKAKHKLEEVVEMVEKKEMPLDSYTLIHKDAELTDQDRNLIITWAKQIVIK